MLTHIRLITYNFFYKFQGMVNQVARDSPALLSIINQAINPIFENPSSVYITSKVRDIMFDGMRINCNVTDFAAKAVCTQIKQQIPGLKSTKQKNIYLFSLLGPVRVCCHKVLLYYKIKKHFQLMQYYF